MCVGLLLFLSLRSLILLLHRLKHRHGHRRTGMHAHTNTPSSRTWTLVVLTHLNDFTSFRDSFSLLVSILLFFSLLLFLYLSFFSFSSMLRFIQSFDRSSWEYNAFVAMQLLVSRRDVIFVLCFFSCTFFVFFGMNVRTFFFQEKHFFSLLFCVRSYNFVWLFFCFRNLIFFLFSSQHHPIVFQIPKKEQNRCFFLNSHFFSSRINDAALKLLLMFDVVAMRL